MEETKYLTGNCFFLSYDVTSYKSKNKKAFTSPDLPRLYHLVHKFHTLFYKTEDLSNSDSDNADDDDA